MATMYRKCTYVRTLQHIRHDKTNKQSTIDDKTYTDVYQMTMKSKYERKTTKKKIKRKI